jgi:hypothetical protein
MSRKAALALGAAIAAFGWVKGSIAATIAGWTFEVSAPGGAGTQVAGSSYGPVTPEIGSGSAVGVHASSSTVWSNPAGNGSNESFSSNVWAGGDYYGFEVDTTGLENIMVDFDQTRSSTGPHAFDFQYSTDGSTFTTFGSYTLAGTSWSSLSAATVPGNDFLFDLSSVSALDNDTSIFFRLVSNGTNSTGGTLATAGTSRVDNVFITGSVIPEPASVGLVSVAAAASMLRRRSKK